ncbi:MAG: MBOAT family protein [Lachnospiraceae bacterium]|nr:MBOAT family protein [Lachnospiraceae bacterium]
MYFSSILFLILFLPVTVLLYYITPNIKVKNIVLLAASLFFYGVGEPKNIFLLLACTLISHVLTILMCKTKYRRGILSTIIILNLGVLCFYKYLGMNVVLPVGISFYTFQLLSYSVDVYRKPEILQKNYFTLLLYITLFPQLVAGPIVKYHDVAEQFKAREMNLAKVAEGLRRFSFGLGKKVLIANTLGNIVDIVYSWDYSHYSFTITWVTAILYALQIYYDFSGYSDMALGLGKIFGFELKENFNYPYNATSIKEFWRKWHISLSTWFKEYLYIPLGGSRKGKVRTIVNKYIVFFLTGLWHGANGTFVIWGLIHGTCSVLEELGSWSEKIKGKMIGWIYTMFVVVVSFVFFRSENLIQALSFLKGMFLGVQSGYTTMSEFQILFNPYVICICIIALIGMFNWKKKLAVLFEHKYVSGFVYVVSLCCIYYCIMALASNSYNPFIYFRF